MKTNYRIGNYWKAETLTDEQWGPVEDTVFGKKVNAVSLGSRMKNGKYEYAIVYDSEKSYRLFEVELERIES